MELATQIQIQDDELLLGDINQDFEKETAR